MARGSPLAGVRPRKGEWKTQDGRILSIKDMDDTHLENSIRMLEGKGVGLAAAQFYNDERNSPKKFDPATATDDEVIEHMEARLVGPISREMMNKYEELVMEREHRTALGAFAPVPPKRTVPVLGRR